MKSLFSAAGSNIDEFCYEDLFSGNQVNIDTIAVTIARYKSITVNN